jgi:signal transduction histidine kinase
MSVLTQPEAGGVVIEIGNPPGPLSSTMRTITAGLWSRGLETATEAAARGTRTASFSIDFSGIVRFIFPRLGVERKYNCDISQIELRISGRRYGLVLMGLDAPAVGPGDRLRALRRLSMSDETSVRVDERRPGGRHSLAFDLALALVATTAEVAQLSSASGTPSGPAIVLAVVAGGALVLRRAAPLTVLATTLATTVAIVALGDDPSGATVLVALYTTAALCEVRVSLVALAATATTAATLSALTVGAPGREASATSGAIIVAGLSVGIWAVGAYAQTRRRYMRELQERAASAEREREQLARIAVHEERTSIARELHDIVAHSVGVMLVGVRGARDVLRSAPETAEETLARVERSGEQSMAELRRILALLREPQKTVESHPQPSLAELDELVASYRGAGLPVRLAVIGEPPSLPGGLELSVYRIVQEALTNTLKHTDPSNVMVALAFRDACLELEVVDDGTPTKLGSAATSGQGIIGMRERAALLGGWLQSGPREGGGFRVAAQLPFGGEA